ncbi:LysE family transporter [Methanospirillum lacunae]|uniref:Lysine transporter LysE n=1 Tax=Methanospirillum lacunae TaxID=668570 RepID=A0A2V2N289_9EURY|nr:LysE family transporter [Methanospirillum lacunae]PWR70638.1 hypothetical protein DK846_14710 [Methanospirillum lacunae]
MKEFKRGFYTGLTLQLAIGPVFFFIINLTLQKTIFDGFAGVLAVTVVDYFFIIISILGVGTLLKETKFKRVFGYVSSVVLILFGSLILKGILFSTVTVSKISSGADILTSFVSVFLITISSPMTIIFFTSLFTAKVVEYNYSKKELISFGFGTGFATFIFMGLSVIIFSFIGSFVPLIIIQILNCVVGMLLIGYGIQRLAINIKE